MTQEQQAFTLWLPITSNPPEDTPVLIWDGNIMCVAQYERYHGINHITKEPLSYITWIAVGSAGHACDNDFDEPTHWMLLPTPPQA